MSLAEANRVQIRFARETAWGETPSGPATTALPITNESLAAGKATLASETIRSDRQITKLLEIGQSASGPISFELTYGDFESWFETALRGTISSVSVATTSAVVGASTIVDTGANFSNFVAGQFVKITDGAWATSGAVVKLTSAATTTLGYIGSTLTASTLVSATILGRTLKNGTTKTSFFVEAAFEDITAVKYFTGISPEEMTLSIASQQIVTGVFTCRGKRGFVASASVASTTTSATTNTPMTAAANVADIFLDNVVLSTAVQSVEISVNNNMGDRPQVGSKTSAQHADGACVVTGNLTTYFEDITLYDKMIAHTGADLSFKLRDADGNVIGITIPQLEISSGDPVTGGQNQDIVLPLAFQGVMDTAQSITIRMDFLPA